MNNSQVIERGLAKALRMIDVRTTNALSSTGEDLIDMTDVPVWTYNLQDSIGCGTYKDSVLMSTAIPPQEATEPRSGAKDFAKSGRYQKDSERPIWGVDGIDEDKAYWGQDELFSMLANPPVDILSHKGWSLRYIAAQPYSQVVDRYADVLEEQNVLPLFLQHIRK